MRSFDMTKVIGSAVLILISVIRAEAQLFPAGGLPMSYNGGFAGESGKHRFVSSTHLNISKFDKLTRKIDQTFSYDVFVPALRSGIGATAGFYSNHHKPVDSLSLELNNPYFSVALSPKISFNGKLTLAPFVDFQFVHSRSLAHYRPDPGDPPLLPTNSSYTVRVGFLLNSEKGYVGLTFVPVHRSQFSEPRYSTRFVNYFYFGADLTKLIFQAGRTFQKNPDSKFSVTPQIAFSAYPQFGSYELSWVDFNLAFRFNKFHTGVGAGGFQFAYDWDRLRAGTALIFRTPYQSGYQTFVNGQLTTIRAYWYIQYFSVRYLI